jgi:hypothetical protein
MTSKQFFPILMKLLILLILVRITLVQMFDQDNCLTYLFFQVAVEGQIFEINRDGQTVVNEVTEQQFLVPENTESFNFDAVTEGNQFLPEENPEDWIYDKANDEDKEKGSWWVTKTTEPDDEFTTQCKFLNKVRSNFTVCCQYPAFVIWRWQQYECDKNCGENSLFDML